MQDCLVVRRMEDHEPAKRQYFEETMMDEDMDSDEEMNEGWYCLVVRLLRRYVIGGKCVHFYISCEPNW